LKEREWSPSASLVMLMTRTIRNIVMCGSSRSMCRTPTPTFGFVWAMCSPITSHVVITWRGWAMEGTSRNFNLVHISSITACVVYLRHLTTSTQLNTRIRAWTYSRLPFFDKVAGCMSSSIDTAVVLIDHYRWERKDPTDSQTLSLCFPRH
jgi:hypothetical protein